MTSISADVAQRFRHDGFAVFADIFEQPQIEYMIRALAEIDGRNGVRSRSGVYAVRNSLQLSDEINELAHSQEVNSIVAEYLGCSGFPVRGMLFDKTGTANWLVPWHQDLSICVASRMAVPGYGPGRRRRAFIMFSRRYTFWRR